MVCGVVIEPATTVVPGRVQTAFDQAITSATSPIALYTVPSGYAFYLDYIFAYMYAYTAGTGAGIGCQLIMDQGASLASCTVARFYRQYDNFAITFKKPMIFATNFTLATLGAAGAGVSASVFVTIAGDVV